LAQLGNTPLGSTLAAGAGGHAAIAAGSRSAAAPKAAEPEIKYCSIDDPSCEACQ